MSLHEPIRPDWTCAACGGQWPCLTRKRQLLGHYHGAYVSLAVYLTGFFIEACQDLPGWPAGALYHRFLAWPAHMPEQAWREEAPTRMVRAGAASSVAATA